MIKEINVAHLEGFKNHEHVYQISDESSGLEGYIAIHNTNLGPATGGTRWWHYGNEQVALHDALDLSRAMTYKCALAGVPFGGGKAVICSSRSLPRGPILKAYGRIINELGGAFTTGTDVGTSEKDTMVMATESSYILGQPVVGMEKFSTSDMAALGVYTCLKAAYFELTGRKDLQGSSVAIKGIGKLGGYLAELLLRDGVLVVAAETDSERRRVFESRYPEVRFVDQSEIHKQPVDIYAPCALGGEFNLVNVHELEAKIIVGGANNQLSSPDVGDALHERGITYLPDYVVNAGGLINIVDELEAGGYQPKRVQERIQRMADVLLKIIGLSQKEKLPTYQIADHLAEEVFLRKNI